MTSVARPTPAAWVVFLLLLGWYGYFYQGGGVGPFSRWALTAALVEHGSVRIDPYHTLTFDKAFKDGHYYCDKAPGLSFLAVPAYWLARTIVGPSPGVPDRRTMNGSLYLMTLLTVALPTALAGALSYRRAVSIAGPWGAFWTTVALGLGSPLAVYAGLFYGHALCAALLFLAFLLLWPAPTAAGENTAARGALPAWRPLLAGFLAGWATLTEMPAALITVALGVWILATATRPVRQASLFVVGGLPLLGLLLAYNASAFGHPLSNGYQFIVIPEFREAMGRGVMGVTAPKPIVMLAMILNPARGLLFSWPFFVFCVLPAALLVGSRAEVRPPAVLALSVLVVFYLFVSGYFLWSGGASFGSRHLIPCLPFAALLVVFAYPDGFRWWTPPAALLSVGIVLVAVSTLAEFPERIIWPLSQYAWPLFAQGRLAAKMVAYDQEGRFTTATFPRAGSPLDHDAWNLGELLGLPGLSSLLPLAVFVVAAVVLVAGLTRRSAVPAPSL